MIQQQKNVKNIADMKKYLETHHIGFGFHELNKSIIDKDMCNMCGACISICPRISANTTKPQLNEYDPECSICLKYCPRTYFPEDLFKKALFKEPIKEDFYLGNYKEAFSAASVQTLIRTSSQDGGLVTSLLIYALERGIIDGALLTDKNEQWEPIPVIATTAEEIKKCAGSKYTITPTLKPYREAIETKKLKKVAIVGMPCQIKAVRKMQLFSPFPSHYGNFELVIGLFCFSNFSYDLIDTFIRQDLQIQPSEIKKMDISHGKFFIYLKDGKIIKVPIRKTSKYKWKGCEFCNDFTAEFADISIGSIGAYGNGWNSILIRTDEGQSLLRNAINDKRIKMKDKIELAKLEKAAVRKKSKKKEINKDVLKPLKMFGLSESALEFYQILIFTGGTTLEVLQEINGKGNLHSTFAVLKQLKSRGWIYRENRLFKAYNPNTVISNEIRKLRDDLEKKITNIELGALNYLKDKFLRNNYTDIKLDELIELI
jgi:coenzyme F420 hydrogenase subunit beta